jgi:4-amino-4-deoxy-L-arabinose transferase-like glycosyltransferase
MASDLTPDQRPSASSLRVLPWGVLALGLATLLRLLAASLIPLSADEAYYRVWAHALAPGFLDHPPMVALWIGAGTAVAGDTALGIRLLGPVSALAGSLLLVAAGRDLALASGADASRAGQVGRRAAWLLNGTLLCNAGAVIMTPDTPLVLFWTACLAAVARAVRTGDAAWWLAAGAAAGLALDSKYTALLLAPALLAWIAVVPVCRIWLSRWQLYAGAALALALFAPVLAWNAAHGWVSFARQGGREGDFAPAEAGRYLFELVAGQLGLATPLLFAVFGWGVWRCLAHGAWRRPAPGLLAAVTLLPALVFVQHALGGRVQANWPSVLYPGAALAAALMAAPFWRPAVTFGAALSACLYLQASVASLALPRRLDFTLIRLAGWGDLARAADQARAAQGAGFVAADEYGLASELAFHMAGPVLGVAPRWALFALPPSAAGTTIGILVRSDREVGLPDPARWPGAVQIGTTARSRHGVVAEQYRLYRVGLPRGVPAVLLPPHAAPAG